MEKSRFLINGELRSSNRSHLVVNPYTSQPVGEVYLASPDDIEGAIEGAVDAFEHTRRLASFERSAILNRIAEEVESRKALFAQTITQETGKPISFSRTEVDRSIFTFRVAASEAERIEGSVLPLDLAEHSAGRFGLTRRFPIGPVAAITPFNFPLNLVSHKVAPAIAVGNPLVLKPSSSGVLTACLLGDIISRAEYPKGGFSITPCSGSEAEQLILDQRIKLISFTGSPVVGWGIKTRSGNKRVVLELGGNAAVIVDRETNIDYAAKRIALGSFGNAGQSCIAVQRIYVHKDLYSLFESDFVSYSKSLMVGDPFERCAESSFIIGPTAFKIGSRKQWQVEHACYVEGIEWAQSLNQRSS